MTPDEELLRHVLHRILIIPQSKPFLQLTYWCERCEQTLETIRPKSETDPFIWTKSGTDTFIGAIRR